MFYQDIDYDNDGINDYRGVFFDRYRPTKYDEDTNIDTSYQDDNGYFKNTVYWFIYETIEWNILQENTGSLLINTDLLLDSQPFKYHYSGDGTGPFYDENNKPRYQNNYDLSDIRKWINDVFYNTAFNDIEKQIIKKTEVDNTSEAWIGYSPNTNDNIFLLSRKEVGQYYDSFDSRIAYGSDYAKCQGLLTSSTNSGRWYLRSVSRPGYFVDAVLRSGYLTEEDVNETCVGIRPACYIQL